MHNNILLRRKYPYKSYIVKLKKTPKNCEKRSAIIPLKLVNLSLFQNRHIPPSEKAINKGIVAKTKGKKFGNKFDNERKNKA